MKLYCVVWLQYQKMPTKTYSIITAKINSDTTTNAQDI